MIRRGQRRPRSPIDLSRTSSSSEPRLGPRDHRDPDETSRVFGDQQRCADRCHSSPSNSRSSPEELRDLEVPLQKSKVDNWVYWSVPGIRKIQINRS